MDLEELLQNYLSARDDFDVKMTARDEARTALDLVLGNPNSTVEQLENAIAEYLNAQDTLDLARETLDEARLLLAAAIFGSETPMAQKVRKRKKRSKRKG